MKKDFDFEFDPSWLNPEPGGLEGSGLTLRDIIN